MWWHNYTLWRKNVNVHAYTFSMKTLRIMWDRSVFLGYQSSVWQFWNVELLPGIVKLPLFFYFIISWSDCSEFIDALNSKQNACFHTFYRWAIPALWVSYSVKTWNVNSEKVFINTILTYNIYIFWHVDRRSCFKNKILMGKWSDMLHGCASGDPGSIFVSCPFPDFSSFPVITFHRFKPIKAKMTSHGCLNP